MAQRSSDRNTSNLWGLLSNHEQTMARFAHPSMRQIMFQQRRISDVRRR
ncbi:MAG: hypothetical protein AAF821_23875 [Cyanobacteria bacterium P01_D01_bin.156]